MRGALYRSLFPLGRVGIIPAYAGSTICAYRIHTGSRDHPRVCGEHLWRGRYTMLEWGSSPRMRGARPSTSRNVRKIGIIPAYAGSTTCRSRPCWMGGDHPRVCGEHPPVLSRQAGFSGSSPRMRGALGKRRVGVRRAGIIPAYAGSTPRSAMPFLTSRDHPRVCGEHSGLPLLMM